MQAPEAETPVWAGGLVGWGPGRARSSDLKERSAPEGWSRRGSDF